MDINTRAQIKKAFSKSIVVALLIAFCLFMVLPLGWMISTSFREPLKAFQLPPSFFPTEFNTENYRQAFAKVDFLKFIKNSLFVSVSATALQLLVSSMAAYAFARINFRGKNVVFIMFLASMMVPGQVVSIPRFIVMSRVHLINSHLALILPGIFSAFAIFLLRQSMLSIPRSYDEAAYMDGATKWQCFSQIIVPMTKPTMMVVAMQTFVATWNEFYGALIYINDVDKMTLPLGLVQLNGVVGTGSKAMIVSGVVISLIPSLLMYCFGQRYLIKGITIGGIK